MVITAETKMQDLYCCVTLYKAKQYRVDTENEVLTWINDVQYRQKRELAFMAKGRIFVPKDDGSFILVSKGNWVMIASNDDTTIFVLTDRDFKNNFASTDLGE